MPRDERNERRTCFPYRIVNARHIDHVRIEVIGGSRALTLPAGLILDVHDALINADIEELLKSVVLAINILDGEHYEAEQVLCRVTTLCAELLNAGSNRSMEA